jgi:hypothetical protein
MSEFIKDGEVRRVRYNFSYGHSFLATSFGAASGALLLASAAPALGTAFAVAAGGVIGATVSRAIYRGLFHTGDSFAGKAASAAPDVAPDAFTLAFFGDDLLIGGAIAIAALLGGYGVVGGLYDGYKASYDFLYPVVPSTEEQKPAPSKKAKTLKSLPRIKKAAGMN